MKSETIFAFIFHITSHSLVCRVCFGRKCGGDGIVLFVSHPQTRVHHSSTFFGMVTMAPTHIETSSGCLKMRYFLQFGMLQVPGLLVKRCEGSSNQHTSRGPYRWHFAVKNETVCGRGDARAHIRPRCVARHSLLRGPDVSLEQFS